MSPARILPSSRTSINITIRAPSIRFLETVPIARPTRSDRFSYGYIVIPSGKHSRLAAMGLCMMPVFTAAMNTLPGPLVARGSSLTNVLNQLFGALGTALFITLLQTRQIYHQAMLAQVVTPDLPGVRATLAAVQRYLVQQGASLAQARAAGGAALYQQVAMRAAVTSFDDCFAIAAAACLLAIVPALFLSNTGIVSGRPADAMPRE